MNVILKQKSAYFTLNTFNDNLYVSRGKIPEKLQNERTVCVEYILFVSKIILVNVTLKDFTEYVTCRT